MKVFGHPVHIVLVHFPSALFPMDVICSALFLATRDALFSHASVCAAVGGAVFGWLAVVFGFLDLIRIPGARAGAMRRALIHGSINAGAVIAYTVFAGIILRHYPAMPDQTVTLLVAKSIVVGGMMVGNFLGGNLVLKDKIGVID
jgi:uncharacterized membrane protein